MTTAIVIPARHASTRYPGKPLVPLTLPDGRQMTLIEMSWRAAMAVPGVDVVAVATDDARIAQTAEGFGARVVMTPETCENGTARCAAALQAGLQAQIVVNLQGDAPLTPPWFVTALLDRLRGDTSVDVATPVLRLDAQSYAHFVQDRHAGRVGGTTAVFGARGQALYFSKEVIPYLPSPAPDPLPVFHHVGVYAYRAQALADYPTWPMGTLERLEELEQLRFLERGVPLACVEVQAPGRVFWELNNPQDVPRIEAALRALSADALAVWGI